MRNLSHILHALATVGLLTLPALAKEPDGKQPPRPLKAIEPALEAGWPMRAGKGSDLTFSEEFSCEFDGQASQCKDEPAPKRRGGPYAH